MHREEEVEPMDCDWCPYYKQRGSNPWCAASGRPVLVTTVCQRPEPARFEPLDVRVIVETAQNIGGSGRSAANDSDRGDVDVCAGQA